MRDWHTLRSVLLGLFGVLPALAAAPAQAAAERDGLQLYQDYGCALCHGIGGHRGGAGGGPIALLRFPANTMPAYAREYIGDDELRRVYDYLVAIEAPPAAQDIPAVRALLEALGDG